MILKNPANFIIISVALKSLFSENTDVKNKK